MKIASIVLLFTEGILTFISPCILPMLPVYIMYLAGNSTTTNNRKLIINILGFITGFTVVFILLGATATTLGSLMNNNRLFLQRIGGAIIILFGLNLIGIIRPVFLNQEIKLNIKIQHRGFFSSMIFGIVFSFGWTPCLGTFLGTALFMASSANTMIVGILLLFVFSMGLAVPFLITAIIFDKLVNIFSWIKKNYSTINLISGSILIIIGVLMLTNLFGYYSRLFNF